MNFSACLLAVLLGSSALAGRPQEAAPAQVVRYRCPPCNPSCDAQRYAAPGRCGRCGMDLVDEKTIPSVAVLLFEDCDLLSFAGPASVFANTSAFEIYTVADTTDPLRCAGGLEATPRYAFGDAPAPALILVPDGGHVDGLASDELVVGWLKKSAKDARAVLTVGTGTYLAGAAGLLEGPATTYPESVRWYADLAAKLELTTEEPIVRAGKVLTARDALAGIEAALELAGEIAGPQRADLAARRIGRVSVTEPVAR